MMTLETAYGMWAVCADYHNDMTADCDLKTGRYKIKVELERKKPWRKSVTVKFNNSVMGFFILKQIMHI